MVSEPKMLPGIELTIYHILGSLTIVPPIQPGIELTIYHILGSLTIVPPIQPGIELTMVSEPKML
jgi:hypothetical protein